VATRVKAAVGGQKSLNTSQDLVQLTERYNVFCKRLQGLIAALKAHFQAMQSLAKTRYSVAQYLAVLSKDTPLFETTGLLPTADSPSESVVSYLSIQEGVAGKAKMYGQKYAQFVIDYAVEWEKVVTSRVDKGLKNAEQLRVELDHYQRKVESLRQVANATMAKGKQVDQKSAERLTRNEEKLVKVRETHNHFIASLCTLIDEVTERSWRDLHPLLVKIAQFEVTLSGDEAKALSSLNTIINEMKRLAVTHGIKPQARLKDLDSLDPSMLSTKAPGSSTLAIEAGVGGLSLVGSDVWSPTSGGGLGSPLNDAQRLPPGTVSPQGLGGFPVSVQSSDNFSVDTRSYDGSLASGYGVSTTPSTLDMLAISASAAPAPTVDMLTAAFGPTPSTGSHSAPPSGAMVPLSSSGGGGYGGFGRKQSFDSFDSGFSGASAPPPAAPPPPPPSQFGTEGAAISNPFGMSSSGAALGSYGSSFAALDPYAPPTTPSHGAPNVNFYSQSRYGQQQSLQPSGSQLHGQQQYIYGQPSPAYGQQPMQNRGTNPFG